MEEPVSIVLRCYNEASTLADTLAALSKQHYGNWELIAFDSGSTDGSLEMIKAFKPRHLVEMKPEDYRPGWVLNEGMRLSGRSRVVFLNADATPQGAHWLEPMVSALAEPGVAAVFGRQIPRPGCEAAFARDYERCFGERRESVHWDHFFSMVSSGLTREAWSLRGFKETMQYSEDDEYTRWCRDHGFRIQYCPDSVVMHSHNYSPHQAYKRAFGEAWALADVWKGSPMAFSPLRTVVLGGFREAVGDLRYCLARGRIAEWPRTISIRCQQRFGRLHGFQAGWQMHRIDKVL